MAKGFEGMGSLGTSPAAVSAPGAPAPKIRRRPLNSEDVLTAPWNLTDAVKHRGPHAPEDQLVPNERKTIGKLWRAKPQSWREFGDAMISSGVQDFEYWLCSAMLKLGTNTLSGVFDRILNDPDLLVTGAAPARLPAGISAGGPGAGLQG